MAEPAESYEPDDFGDPVAQIAGQASLWGLAEPGNPVTTHATVDGRRGELGDGVVVSSERAPVVYLDRPHQRPTQQAPPVQSAQVARPTPPGPAAPASGNALVTGHLTGRGVLSMIAGATLTGGLLDVALYGHRGQLFGLAFVLASIAGGALVRRRDLAVAAICPPLVYIVVMAAFGVTAPSGSGSLLARQALYLGDGFVTGAPAIWAGTAGAAAVGYLRWRLRRPRRP